MNRKSLIVFLLLIVFGIFPVRGQMDMGKDWFSKHNIYPEPVSLRPDKYSLDDAERFHQKLDSIFQTVPRVKSPWSGLFGDDVIEVGISQLVWKPEVGFVSYYVYTCMPELRSFDFGSAVEKPDSIIIRSERTGKVRKLVKVTWGKRQYVVDERSVKAFAEKAAGIFVEQSEAEPTNEWANYWLRSDNDEDLIGLPILPMAYRHLARLPIYVSILSIVSREMKTDFELRNSVYNGEKAIYRVGLRGGTELGIKPGLRLRIGETQDEITIVMADRRRSEGIIVREISEDTKSDSCVSDTGEPVPCPKLRPGLRARTETGRMFF